MREGAAGRDRGADAADDRRRREAAGRVLAVEPEALDRVAAHGLEGGGDLAGDVEAPVEIDVGVYAHAAGDGRLQLAARDLGALAAADEMAEALLAPAGYGLTAEDA